jgi:uncharacterized RmlC-like cupin family protein
LKAVPRPGILFAQLKRSCQVQETAMKTRTVSKDEMEQHIARFDKLVPQKAEYEKRGIPSEAFEMLAAKTIYLLMAPGGDKGSTAAPAIVGKPGLTVNIVSCPPGNGPMLHAHMETQENFMPLTGKWEVSWGDKGEIKTILAPFDLIAVPPGTARQFKNVSDEEAMLLVLVQGEEALNDIFYSTDVGDELVRRFGPGPKEAFEKIGFSFELGI